MDTQEHLKSEPAVDQQSNSSTLNENHTPQYAYYYPQESLSIPASDFQPQKPEKSVQPSKPLKLDRYKYQTQDYREYQTQMQRLSVGSFTGGRRYCCGIFGSRKGCVLTLLSIFIMFVAGLMFLAYYLFPKAPVITFKNPLENSQSALGTLKFSTADPIQGILKASKDTPFVASMQLELEFQVFSPNNIEYDFNDLKFDAFLLDAGGSSKTVGDKIGSGATGKVSFPPQKQTTVKLPFLVQFTLDDTISNIAGNAQIFSLVRSCAPNLFPGLPPAAKPGQIWFRIRGTISSSLVDWTGITPTFDKDLGFNCPAGALDLSKLVQSAMALANTKKV